MKKYIFITIGGRNTRIEINEELDKLLRRSLKEQYIFDSNGCLKTNQVNDKDTFLIKAKILKSLIATINNYNISPELKERITYLESFINLKKGTIYGSDLTKLETLFNETCEIYNNVKSEVPLKSLEVKTNELITKINNSNNNTEDNLELASSLLDNALNDEVIGKYLSSDTITEALDNVIICESEEEYQSLTNTKEEPLESYIDNNLASLDAEKIILPPNATIEEVVKSLVSSKYISTGIKPNENIDKTSAVTLNTLLTDLVTNFTLKGINKSNIAYYGLDFIKKYMLICKNNGTDFEHLLKGYFRGEKNEIELFMRDIVKYNGGDNSLRYLMESMLIEQAVNKKLISRDYLKRVHKPEELDKILHNFETGIKTDLEVKNGTANISRTIGGIENLNNSSISPNITNFSNEILSSKDDINAQIENDIANNTEISNTSLSENELKTNPNNAPVNNSKDVSIPKNNPEVPDNASVLANINQPEKTDTTMGIAPKIAPTNKKIKAKGNLSTKVVTASGIPGIRRNGELSRIIEQNNESIEEAQEDIEKIREDIEETQSSEENIIGKSNDLDIIDNEKNLENASNISNVNDNTNNALLNGVTNEAQKKAQKVLSKRLLEFIKKNPTIIIGAGIVLLILLILIIIIVISEEQTSKYTGLGGYPYLSLDNLCEEVYVVDTPSGEDGVYSLEEYVAGVVAHEIGAFNNDTMYEVGAIAARTYALRRMQGSDSCKIAGNTTAQVFGKTDNARIIAAAEKTKGLVLTKDGAMTSTEYDAFCWDTKDANYYNLCQHEFDTGNTLQVPISWAEEYVAKISGRKFLTTSRYQSHGRGMSQQGAYYLAMEKNYSRDDILAFFYGSDAKLMSIYPSSFSGEYPINPGDTLYQNLAFLTNESLESLLSKNGETIEGFNNYLQSVVESAGVGSREAVVNVAVSLIGRLAEMGYKLNYQWGGKYYFPGVSKSWGLPVGNSSCDSYASLYNNKSKCLNDYKYASFDCSGFVHWALINGFGMQNYSELSSSGLYAATRNATATRTKLNSNMAVCQPGDFLAKEGHIVLVVGLKDDTKQYIVAESTGSNLNQGTGGVKLSYYSYGAKQYYCGKLDKFYK